MIRQSRILGLAAAISCIAMQTSATEPGPVQSPRDADAALQLLTAARPGLALQHRAGRIRRVFGRPFSEGLSAVQSAEHFRFRHARALGLEPGELVADVAVDGAWARPVMHLPEEGRYRFTALAYRQSVGGIPVFRSRLVLLVRNEPGYPLVLAAADLRDTSGLAVDPSALPPSDPSVLGHLAVALYAAGAQVVETTGVVWAGVDDLVAQPRLAHRSLVAAGEGRWLMVTDAFTGELLYEEDLLRRIDFEGVVSGLATEGAGAEQCELEVTMAIPHARVTLGATPFFTGQDGSFAIPTHGLDAVDVTATLDGRWFDVRNAVGPEIALTQEITAEETAELLLNATNTAHERAQVNAYLAAGEIRAAVLEVSPGFPGLNVPGFMIWVNRTDSLCPGNAWYSPDGPSLNFCQAADGYPNTAWSAVVYHEYGHHLVSMAGSGQGPYGEGMGDALTVVMLDVPDLGLGFYGSCSIPLRSADNDCQYQQSGCSSCGVSAHLCGQLLSGCVWDLRNELLASEPESYRQTLATLVVNSMLLHVGSVIDPSITIDFLVLDDDNADLGDGTPHYEQIADAFGAHGMPAPPLDPVRFEFPDGLPDIVAPAGGDAVRVEVHDLAFAVEPGTGMLHLSETGEPDSFFAVPMTEVAPNVYDAVFPEMPCASLMHYYFSVGTTGGPIGFNPAAAPLDSNSVIAATSSWTEFNEDFELDGGWTVESGGGLSDGAWEIDVPEGGGNRGDPPSDADGSGRCALTDNADGNSDVDNGWTMLTSPVLDALAESGVVSYWRWFSNSEGTGAFQDVFTVEVSGDGGGSWVTLETVGPEGPDVSGGWYFRQFRVAEHVEPSAQFRIRFIAQDVGTPSVVEAAVDGVSIRGYACEPPSDCASDANGDRLVDVDDLLAVIIAWGESDSPADVTGDGLVNVDDLVAVVLAWGPCD